MKAWLVGRLRLAEVVVRTNFPWLVLTCWFKDLHLEEGEVGLGVSDPPTLICILCEGHCQHLRSLSDLCPSPVCDLG